MRMQSKRYLQVSLRYLFVLLTLLLVAGASLLAQEEGESETVQVSPVMQGFEIARELIEEDLGERMRLRRWRFYEDNWSSTASGSLYGSFGIDSCADSVPFAQKRDNILFGWTYIFTTTAGMEHQARVSYDLQAMVICDEVHVPPQYAPPPAVEAAADEGEDAQPQAVASTANLGVFALGGHITGLDASAVGHMKNAAHDLDQEASNIRDFRWQRRHRPGSCSGLKGAAWRARGQESAGQ